MEKYVVVVFDNEAAAYIGADAMRDLHRNGELASYAAGVNSNYTDGNVELKSTCSTVMSGNTRLLLD